MINPYEKLMMDAQERALVDATDAHMELHDCDGILIPHGHLVQNHEGATFLFTFYCLKCGKEIRGYGLDTEL